MDKRCFDAEYQTQWRDEVDYLKSVGIGYTFVKRINGVSTYKYRKDGELFKELAIFYGQRDKQERSQCQNAKYITNGRTKDI